MCTSGAPLPVWPMLFFHTWHKIRMATSGPICLGGMITMIARHVDVDFDGLEVMTGKRHVVDLTGLLATNMFTQVRGQFYFLLREF